MRAIAFAAIVGALFVLSATRAGAVTEFCPANLSVKAVAMTQDQPATTYGFMLRASRPRTVAATLAFDTDKGWFTATVAPAPLLEKTYHYSAPSRTAVTSDWISPIMYVRFPSATSIVNSWVSNANAQACSPSPPSPKNSATPKALGYVLDPKDEDRLDAAPSPNSLVIPAQKAAALFQPVCANPFRDGRVVSQGPINLGEDAEMHGLSGETDVEVAINKDGTLADAWVYLSSGEAMLDNAALWAAQHSTYQGAMAYCEPVPARYLFKTSFG